MNFEKENNAQIIKALLSDGPWSNSACCGYILFALNSLGYSKTQKREIISALNIAFGNHSVDDAKKKYELNLET